MAGISRGFDREVRFGDVSYEFSVRSGADSWRDLKRKLAVLDADRFVIVADAGLTKDTVAEVEAHVAAIAPVTTLTIRADETEKTLTTLVDLAEKAIPAGVTRRSVVIALGGGLVGNLAGLLAALIFRGIRLVHLPTTLLAMSDSVLSLKQAVNSSHGKNHLGTFHEPVFVWNHLDFLATLPVVETQSALCEMIKNVLGIVPERYDEVASALRTDGHYTTETITRFIDLCVDAKTTVMAKDPWEKGEALILEYGHTIGHAAELLTGGELLHGHAVGLGMLAAARISRELGHLDRADELAHLELLRRNGAPTRLPEGLDVEAVLATVRLDNKRGYLKDSNGKRDLILLEALGRPHRTGSRLITQVDEEVIRLGINSIAIDDVELVVA